MAFGVYSRVRPIAVELVLRLALDPSACGFYFLPGEERFYRGVSANFDVRFRVTTSGDISILENGLPTIEDVNRLLLEYLALVGGLPLTPDDFIDPNTGEFVCTNEKLRSLL